MESDEVNLDPRGLDAGLGFLLKSVDHPNIRAYLYGIDHPESIPSMPERNLEHAAVNALERLCLVRFAPLGGYRESAQHDALHVFGKFLEIPPRSLDP